MPDQTCILCGAIYTAPASLKSYQGLCSDHWSEDTLREIDRIESARKYLQPGMPDILTLAEWLAIVASYCGQCALCEINPSEVCAIWVPVDGLVAGNVVPLCKICHHFKENSFLSAMERVRKQLAIQAKMLTM
jgi:hypothetical protein